jgi:hypothetical protein
MQTPLPSLPSPSAAAQYLTEALDRLIGRGTLSKAQAEAVLAEVGMAPGAVPPPTAEADRRGWTTVLAEVGGYIGAAFVIAAALVFTGPQWQHLSRAGREAVLGIPALLVLAGAVALAQAAPGGWSPRARTGLGARRRLVSALVLVGGGLLGGLTAELLQNQSAADSGLQATAAALTVTAVWAVGFAGCRILLLHLATAVASCVSVMTTISWRFGGDVEPWWMGAGLVAVALVWAGLTALGAMDDREVGYPVAGIIAFIGSELLSVADHHAWIGYLLLAVLAVAGLAGYVRARLVPVLVVGVVSLATVVPQSIIDYTNGALGAAGALLVTGLSIVGASVVGLRIRREVPGRHG